MKRILFTLISTFCSVATLASEVHPIYGIIIPLPLESSYLQNHIEHKKDLTIAGITYHLGTIKNKNIVFVNAGLGKVNSAIISTRLVRDFHPDEIFMSGSSGSINSKLKKLDVLIGKQVVNVDLGVLTKNGLQFKFSRGLMNPQSHTQLPLTFQLNDQLDKTISQINKLHLINVKFGKIATSDALPNQPAQVALLQDSNFDVVEMEGASLMQVCWLFKTPCVVIRGVSNNMSEAITTEDVKTSADKAAKVLITILQNQI